MAAPGFFGTDGRYTFDGGIEGFKTPHLRNVYQKVGMFGMPNNPVNPGSDAFLGDQVRGFGFHHDGSIPTIFLFNGFTSNGGGLQPVSDDSRRLPARGRPAICRSVRSRISSSPSTATWPPSSGSRRRSRRDNASVVGERIDLLIDRARAGECDLVAKGGGDHGEKGYLYDVASDRFLGNRRRDAPVSDASLRLRALQDGGELTYTCTPPGSGVRIGIDRDEDGVLDGDEEDARGDRAVAIGTTRAAQRHQRR